MRIFCNGFNLYGKFNTDKPLIEEFQSIDMKDVDDVEVSLTFAVFIKKNKLYISGGTLEEKSEVNYDFGIIKFVSCNIDEVFVLTDDGAIFRVDIKTLEVAEHIVQPVLDKGDKLIRLAIGSRIKVGSSQFGYLYDLVSGSRIDVAQVRDVQAGATHCLILNAEGDVYVFGSGSRGQLGLSSLEDQPVPVQVEALGGIKIVAIACGYWHSAAISAEGDLYIWGWNQSGQLGLPSDSAFSVMACPHVIDFPNPNAIVTKVACGSKHTVVLLSTGEMFGCGLNKYKQLIPLDTDVCSTMTFMGNFNNEEITGIKCGHWNSVVCCDDNYVP